MEKAKPLEMKWHYRHCRIVAALLAMGIVLLLAGCTRDTPEQALRLQLQRMQDAAGERDTGSFMEKVTGDFTGNDGMDRAALHNLLRMQMLANRNAGVTMGPVEVDLRGERATVHFTVLLTGGSGRLIPDSAQGYSITSGWRIEDGDWRVYYANWETKL